MLLITFGVTAADAPPNIFIAISHDQSYPHTGAYRDPIVRTPAFDRVAERGVLFSNAFSPAPLPDEARAVLLPPLKRREGYTLGEGDLAAFLQRRDRSKPFVFWMESTSTCRPYKLDSGVDSGKRLQEAGAPFFLPDMPPVRSDMLDYYTAIEKFDREVMAALTRLEESGDLENTVVIVTSLNGFAFPRAKGNVYDYGVHVPLAVMWRARAAGRRTISDFVSTADLTGIMRLVEGEKSGRVDPGRDHIVVRSKTAAAVRTDEWLYIQNGDPQAWPAGEPPEFRLVEESPSKQFMIAMRGRHPREYHLAFDKRPAEELYDVVHDKDELKNLADHPRYAAVKAKLGAMLRSR